MKQEDIATSAATPSTSSAPSTTAATPASSSKKKRRRTRSHNSSPSPGRGFFVPGFSEQASMSLSDVMDAAKGITNMYLAHEIAVDKDFSISDLNDSKDDINLQSQVRAVVEQAFWDVLDEQLRQEPPEYAQALNLLKEIKETLLSLLSPQQKRVINMINEKLDVDLVRQQAEHGSLEFKAYADFVVTLMSQLCAPVRDEEIEQLRSIMANDGNNIVPLFKGIMKTLGNMKLDMANFHIQQARPLIVSQSVEYEKAKFKEFLAKLPQQSSSPTPGLETTLDWLQRHAPNEQEVQEHRSTLTSAAEISRYDKLCVQRVMTEAFLEILEWDDHNMLPETLAMDAKRITALRDSTERAALSTAIILLTFSNVASLVPASEAQRLKETMKKKIDILLKDFYTDEDLVQLLPSVSLQVVEEVNSFLKSSNKEPLSEATAKTLHEQIAEMEDPNHRIRDLVQRRIVDFNKQALTGARNTPLQVPPGLTLCQRELAHIAGTFVKLVNYNRAVFGEWYIDLIENHVLFKTNDQQSTHVSREH